MDNDIVAKYKLVCCCGCLIALCKQEEAEEERLFGK